MPVVAIDAAVRFEAALIVTVLAAATSIAPVVLAEPVVEIVAEVRPAPVSSVIAFVVALFSEIAPAVAAADISCRKSAASGAVGRQSNARSNVV